MQAKIASYRRALIFRLFSASHRFRCLNSVKDSYRSVILVEHDYIDRGKPSSGEKGTCPTSDGVKVIDMMTKGELKKGYWTGIEEETEKNTDFRRVLYTGKNSQLVLMSLKPREEIGEEVHESVDQFFRFEEGQGTVIINGAQHPIKDGSAVIVPSGARHNVVNTSDTADLKLYTIYSPPNHRDKVVHRTKAEAMADDEHFDGRTTE